jgi:hypothetical protein
METSIKKEAVNKPYRILGKEGHVSNSGGILTI